MIFFLFWMALPAALLLPSCVMALIHFVLAASFPDLARGWEKWFLWGAAVGWTANVGLLLFYSGVQTAVIRVDLLLVAPVLYLLTLGAFGALVLALKRRRAIAGRE